MTDKTKTDHYSITVTGRHVQVTDAMKQYAIEKISKLERFSDRIIDVQITMDIQKLDHIVDIVLKVNHTLIKSHATSTDMYASINTAVQKLERQVRRYKKRLQEHHATPLEMIDLNVNVIRPHALDDLEEINDQIEEENQKELEEELKPHEIVGREVIKLKTLSEADAIMKMDLSGDRFMLFRHEGDRKLRLIYRRNDKNYGIIEPEA